MAKFGQQVAGFVKALEKVSTDVVRDAGVSMYDLMQTPLHLGPFAGRNAGTVPYDTGTLQGALESSIDGMSFGMGAFSYRASLGQLKLGQSHRTARGPNMHPEGYPATVYAAAQEFDGPPVPRAYTRTAASMWIEFVEKAARRIGSRGTVNV